MARHKERDGNPVLDLVEVGLIAKMGMGSGKQNSDEKSKHPREHGKGKESLSQDEPQLDAMRTVEKKKKRRKHQDSAEGGSSAEVDCDTDVDEMSIDLDSIRAERHRLAVKLQANHELEMAKFRENCVKVKEKKKRKSHELDSQEYLGSQIRELEEEIAVDEDEARGMKLEEKRRRKEEKRAARRYLAHINAMVIGDGGSGMVSVEETVVVGPEKMRKLDKRASQENLQFSRPSEEPSTVDVEATDGVKSLPKKKKRKLDRSSQTSPFQLKSNPVYDAKSCLTLITKANPAAQSETFGGNDAMNSTAMNRKKRKLKRSQESLLHLHAVPAHQSASISKHTIFDDVDGQIHGVPEKRNEKHEKNAEKRFPIPSSLLTTAAKAKEALLQTVIKGCGSHDSSGNPASEAQSKALTATSNATSLIDFSEDEKEQASTMRLPQPKTNASSSPPLIRPQKTAANEVKESPILPPKKLVQTATRTPVVIKKLVRPKKVKAKSTEDSDSEMEASAAQKHKAPVSNMSRTVEACAEAESFSQTIALIKKATSSKIHELFSDDESKEEESFSQVVDSIKKSSSKLRFLFSPEPNSLAASITERNRERNYVIPSGSTRVIAARSISTSLGPMPNGEGVNVVSDEWETTDGKVRGTAWSDDDTEAQESILSLFLPSRSYLVTDNQRIDIAFSSSYIASQGSGINISKTNFQVHSLRHTEGWVVSSSLDLAEKETGNCGSDFKLKICIVISGRVQVRLGKDGFRISKGGVFRVRGGEECVVRNGERKGAVMWVVCVE
jgi:hypothetical protein